MSFDIPPASLRVVVIVRKIATHKMDIVNVIQFLNINRGIEAL